MAIMITTVSKIDIKERNSKENSNKARLNIIGIIEFPIATDNIEISFKNMAFGLGKRFSLSMGSVFNHFSMNST